MIDSMKRRKHAWMWVLTALFILMIWHNSIATGTESGNLSRRVAEFLLRYVNRTGFYIDFDTFHFYVRKLAHFSEYFALACLVTLSSYSCPLIRPIRIQPFFFWIIVPCIDEAIQHFVPGRYGSPFDVCIDMAGFFCGIILTYLIILVWRDLRSLFTSSKS